MDRRSGNVTADAVQPHFRMRVQKIPHSLRFVRRQIVENDVDPLLGPALPGNLSEEIDKAGAGVARCYFSIHAPGYGVERLNRRLVINAKHVRSRARGSRPCRRDSVGCLIFLDRHLRQKM